MSAVESFGKKAVRGFFWISFVVLAAACSAGSKLGSESSSSEAAISADLAQKLIANGSHLEMTSAPQSVALGACSKAVSVQLQNSSGQLFTFKGSIGVPLSALPNAVLFFSDAKCTNAVTMFTLSGGTATGRFFFKGTAPGEVVIEANLLNLISAEQTETIISAGTTPSPTPIPSPAPTPVPTPTPPQAQTPVKIGEEAILATQDSGNADRLLAQRATLTTRGTLQSLSFYVGNPDGQLRLGVYDATGPNGGPGALKAETAMFTPVAGWNTKMVLSPVLLPAGDYWLAYTPSSNNLTFRVGGGGELRYYSRAFGPLPTTFATSGLSIDPAHWSFYATVLVDSALLPPPTFISKFVSMAANWSNPSIIGGKPWYNHHGGRAYSLTKLDDTTLRMEVRQGDPEAIDVGGERSEISGGWVINPTDLIDVEFDYMLEPGPSFVVGQNGLAWATLLQIHGDVRPCWIGFEGAEKIFLAVNADVNYDQREWHSMSSLVRGQTYKFRLQLKRSPSSPNGYVKLWIDGVLVADFTGIRVSGMDNYVKLGLYRGWNGLVPQTTAVRYSNILVR